MLLPSWSGWLACVMHRAGLSSSEVAAEAGVCRQYFSKIYQSQEPSAAARSKFTASVIRCLEKRGYSQEEIEELKKGSENIAEKVSG